MEELPEVHVGRHGKELLMWDFWEFKKYDRGPLWYGLAISLAVALLLSALISGNFLFALIIVMFGLVMYLVTIAQPSRVRASITETGIIVGTAFYPYREMRHFWIVYDPPGVQKLYLDAGGLIRPRIVLELEEVNPNAVRKAIGRFVPEDLTQDGEPLADILGRLLKIS